MKNPMKALMEATEEFKKTIEDAKETEEKFKNEVLERLDKLETKIQELESKR